jgi:hypothetical protein
MWRYLFIFILLGCETTNSNTGPQKRTVFDVDNSVDVERDFLLIKSDVRMGRYFESMDSLCHLASIAFGRKIDEYLLIHNNRRIIDTLIQQDYYLAKEQGRYIQDQRLCIALHAGDTLFIPTQIEMDQLNGMLDSVLIDVNIPEYTLRIWVKNELKHRCKVRVGKNDSRYLALAHREVNLQTPVGRGHIVRIERNPTYINPVDGHRYKSTRRDDGMYTQLPRIPFLEPELNGIRPGALIHPTTNRNTLGKAISNGCVGLSEADAWMVYYYAPLGTEVVFRYDLDIIDSLSNAIRLMDVYKRLTL